MLDVVEFPSHTATVPQPRRVRWAELADHLTRHGERAAKGGPLWSPATYREGAARGNDGVESVTAVTFETDHAEPSWALLDGLEYVACTTWSHHADAPKCGRADCPHWRVVIRLARPVPRDEWGETWERARFWLCPDADTACKDAARMYYPPSCRPGASRDSRRGRGAPLDPLALQPAPKLAPVPADPKANRTSRAGRPSDRFGAETDWVDILEPHGWRRVATVRDGSRRWKRPGKADAGCSATTGGGGHDVLYVVSSNAPPFEANTSYTKFRAYGLLEHGGDDKAAARALAERYAMPRQSAADQGADDRADDPRPRIDVSETDLPVLTGQAWVALEDANDPPALFQRGGGLVRLDRGDDGAPAVRPLTPDRMTYRLARVARFCKVRRDRDGNEHTAIVPPPAHVVRDLLACPDPPMPGLARIARSPYFCADGALVTEPGYHAPSRTWLDLPPGLAVGPVPGRPTPADIGRARALLADELLGDFPFTGEPERAHALACLVLPFARELIDGPTPLHLIDKPAPGTGGSLLADLLPFPALGRPAPMMTEGRDEDEWRKRVTAKLADVPAVVVLDNVRGRLDSAALSSAITATVWEDRLLGKSEMLHLPVRAAWLAVGNNVATSDEIARRTVRIRLDARCDTPWLRDGWRHPDLRRWAAEHRGELVWAALTLIQAWLAADRPRGTVPLGMFERWAEAIGGILAVAGVPGFLGNLREFYAASDVERAAWLTFLGAWWRQFGARPVGARELHAVALACDPALPLGDGGERSQRTRLGRLLGAQRERVFGLPGADPPLDVRLAPAGIEHRAQQWRLDPRGPREVPNLPQVPPTSDGSAGNVAGNVGEPSPSSSPVAPSGSGDVGNVGNVLRPSDADAPVARFGRVGTPEPRPELLCFACHSDAWRERPPSKGGGWVCGVCHPPIDGSEAL